MRSVDERKIDAPPPPMQSWFYEQEDLPEQPIPKSFTVMTWNIQECKNFPAIIDQLKTASPDILCVQEVMWTDEGNFAQKLAESLGYKYTLYTSVFPNMGMATFSKFPITGYSTTPLQVPHTFYRRLNGFNLKCGRRVFQNATINVGQDVTILHAWLENLLSTSERIDQFHPVLQASQDCANPTIILGDLNTAAQSWALYFDERGLRALSSNLFSPEAYRKDPLRVQYGPHPTEADIWRGEKAFGDFQDSQASPTFKLWLYQAQLDWILTMPGQFERTDLPIGPKNISDHSSRAVKLTLAS